MTRKTTCTEVLVEPGILLTVFDPALHRPGSMSRTGVCGQGGSFGGQCLTSPTHSVVSAAWTVSTCPGHLCGALHEAKTRLALLITGGVAAGGAA